MPYIEHIYMSEKKSNHVIEKYDILKMCQCWRGGNEQKVAAKSIKIKTVQLSHSVNGLAQNRKIPAYPPGGLE